jgi:hypothetical protein
MKVNPINKAVQPEIRKAALNRYKAYSSEWEKAYFDRYSGGYVVASQQRIEHSKASKNEMAKFTKELEMAKIFAKNGYKIEMLNEIPRIPSPDVKINGLFGDLKRVSGHNNIVKYANKAINTQGADLILFQFDKLDELTLSAINALKLRKIKGMYFVTGEYGVVEF